MKNKTPVYFFFIIMFFLNISQGYASVPLASDSRIRTLIYNENEVFYLTVHYGYQSNVEFSKGEEVETISVGNAYSWQITPVDRRLFIKPLETGVKTNMTVITNKRTYQFEIESKDAEKGVDDQLVYVVRFFYPEESFDQPLPRVSAQQFMSPDPVSPSQSFMSGQSFAPLYGQRYRYNYTLTGPDSIAPVKVFDDGQSTYFQFKNANAVVPYIFVVGANGAEKQAGFRRKGDYIVVDTLASQFILRVGSEKVCVFNETQTSMRGM